MKVTLVPCGPAANDSERKAFGRLKAGLVSLPGQGEWVLLTNLAFSVTHQLQSDEIDIVAVGPPGVRVIEVKHWTNRHASFAEAEADRLTMKARKVGTSLRKLVPELPRVDGAVLLTQPQSRVTRLTGRGKIRGVGFHALKEWREAAGADGGMVLRPEQVTRIARHLAPRNSISLSGSPRRLAGYINLEPEPETPWERGFHRMYRGVHSTRKDRVLLHLYDLSASGGGLEHEARREHDALRRLQIFDWAPRILDSIQDVPGYAEEMRFFTVLDPAAPTMAERASDESWTDEARMAFAESAVDAVVELHGAGADDEPMLHRRLSPDTILVTHDNKAVLTGFGLARIPSEITLSPKDFADGAWKSAVAPEVRERGLGAADARSDTYSLCASLATLFPDPDPAGPAAEAPRIFADGTQERPEARLSLHEVQQELAGLIRGKPPTSPVPDARFWTEGQRVGFRGRDYRVVARLGSGGSGTVYKVVELHSSTKEEVGTFVAKVAHNREHGNLIRDSHERVRQAAGSHPALSSVFEVTTEWRENEFTALMTWIDGPTLGDFAGVVPLLAEDHETDSQNLALRWLRTMCGALEVLHRNGLVHGDVSPRNMLVAGEDLVLTDYDCAARIGEPSDARGTRLYCSPSKETNGKASPGDDLHALAASFFHVLFEREPFPRRNGGFEKGKLDWQEGDREAYPQLVEFLDAAVHSDPAKRLESVRDALATLPGPTPTADPGGKVGGLEGSSPMPLPIAHSSERRPNEVEWLRHLLGSYPGSRWGNHETRGLDTDFSKDTYVETDLEANLLSRIMNRDVGLVILCGNAGDGKTALLQHLADRLGMGEHASAQRIVDRVIENGLRVRMNLDGSAAHAGRSADEILDEFMEPFRDGHPGETNLVHLLAINDGKLLEWIRKPPRTKLKSVLERRLGGFGLDGDSSGAQPHIAFHHLNQRSRVGKVSLRDKKVTTSFLDRLLERLYGGSKAPTIWAPCRSCSAQDRCRVSHANQVFAPDSVAFVPGGETGITHRTLRARARQRLYEALQAVHFRGETHITIRELRSALVYILFGTRYCTDYHDGTAASEMPYWDRAFDPKSHRRQGEVLGELVHLDPALEAHPKIDRKLLRLGRASGLPGSVGARDTAKALASGRRRAYFEWTEEEIEQVVREEGAKRGLELTHGRHLKRFRSIPLLNDTERSRLCADLCRGIGRLGDLPQLAFTRRDVVPLRIEPRTPTETAFWCEKPLSRFRLEAEVIVGDASSNDSERRLHRKANLVYRYESGEKERLSMSARLFHRLLRLAEGYQLADMSSDDTFARLSIFLQRLVREGDREVMAWTPMRDDVVYHVAATMPDTDLGTDTQRLSIQAREHSEDLS